MGRTQTFIPPAKSALGEISELIGMRTHLTAFLWIIFLALYGVGIALAGSDSTTLTVGLTLGIPLGVMIWKRPELGVLGIVFLTSSFIPPDLVDLRLPIGGGLELRDLAFLGMLGLLTIRGLSRRSLSIPWWPVGGPLLVFILISILSAIYALFSMNVETTLVLGELRIFLYYGTFFITAWSIRRSKQLYTLLTGLFLLADATAVIVILQQFLGSKILLLEGMESTNWQLWDQGGSGLGSVRIVPAGHVLMVFMMVIAFCLMISAWKSRRLRYISLFQFLFLNAGLLFTYTRAQWIGAAAAILISILVLLPHYRKLILQLGVIGLAGLVFLVGFLGSDLQDQLRSIPVVDSMMGRALSVFAVSETVDSNSLQWRLFETEEAFRSIGEEPWMGVGLGNSYRELTTLQGEHLGWMAGARGITDLYRFTRYVHNSFLMIAVKIGIPGILLLLWFSGAFLVGSWTIFQRIKHDVSKGLVLGSFAGLIGLLLWSLFHSQLMEAQSTPVIGLIIGMVAAIGHISLPEMMSSPARLRAKLTNNPRERSHLTTDLQDQPLQPGAIPSPLRASFSNNLVFTLAGSGSTIIILFVETMIASRWLDTFSFGIYLLAITVTNFCVMAIDFGFKTAITQMIASSNRERQGILITNTLFFRLGVAGAISGIILIGRKVLSLVDPTDSLIQLAPLIPLMITVYSFDELLSAMLQGLQVYKHMAIAQITRSVLRLGLTLFFLGVLKLGMVSLIYSWLISFGISAVYQFIFLPVPKRISFKGGILKEILKFGAPIQTTRFLWFASGLIHVFLLSTLSGPVSVAIFGIAEKIPTALQRLSESFTAVFFPTVSNLLSKENVADAQAILNASLRLISFLGSSFALVAILFSREVIVLLFTEKYAASAFLFSLLAIALHMGMLINLMGYTLTAAGFPGRSLSENILRTTINIGGAFILIPILGFLGPAVAKIAASYCSNPLSIWLLRKSKIKVTVGPLLAQTLLLLSSAFLYWGYQPFDIAKKGAVIGLFTLISFLIPTISFDDLGLILPKFKFRKGRSIPKGGLEQGAPLEA